jgi:hypothetical protein
MVGENRYRGNFHNSQYNVSGTISVVIRGTKQDVTLISDGASASLTLMRLPTASVAATIAPIKLPPAGPEPANANLPHLQPKP